jgi:hypothetical protein
MCAAVHVQAHGAAGGTFSSWLDRVGNKVEMIASAAADKLSANVAKVSIPFLPARR